MRIRCAVQMSGTTKKLVLVSQENETPEHIALKLASFILFFQFNPAVEVSSKNPAISSQEFKPDLLALDPSGGVRLWMECGNVTTHKLGKLIRRYRDAKITVLKETEREALNLREALKKDKVSDSKRIEILSFPDRQFEEWMKCLEESTEIVGELSEKSFNLVANGVPFSFDFLTT